MSDTGEEAQLKSPLPLESRGRFVEGARDVPDLAVALFGGRRCLASGSILQLRLADLQQWLIEPATKTPQSQSHREDEGRCADQGQQVRDLVPPVVRIERLARLAHVQFDELIAKLELFTKRAQRSGRDRPVARALEVLPNRSGELVDQGALFR